VGTPRSRSLLAALVAGVAAAASVPAACDGGAPAADPDRPADRGADPADDRAPVRAVDPGAREGVVAAEGAWVRAAIVPASDGSGPGTPAPANTAAYLTLRNASDVADALVGVQSPIADTAELHHATMADGVMRMRPVDSVAVPAGGSAVLEPGGYHVMLVGLRSAVGAGDTVALTLRLRSGRVLELAAPVRRSPPE
jgi:copper(I)-binding protein